MLPEPCSNQRESVRSDTNHEDREKEEENSASVDINLVVRFSINQHWKTKIFFAQD